METGQNSLASESEWAEQILKKKKIEPMSISHSHTQSQIKTKHDSGSVSFFSGLLFHMRATAAKLQCSFGCHLEIKGNNILHSPKRRKNSSFQEKTPKC